MATKESASIGEATISESSDDENRYKKALANRLSRVVGHLQAVKRMIEEDRDAEMVLTQIAAVKSAVNGVGKAILQHLFECRITSALKANDEKTLEDLTATIVKYLK